MKKRIVNMIIIIVMVIGLVPSFAFSASAEETPVAKVDNVEYTDFWTAVENWTDNTTLTLLADVTDLTEEIETYGKGMVLDLNGHKLDSSASRMIWIDGATSSQLTIRDSQGGGEIYGMVYIVGGNNGRGTLTLESGTIRNGFVMANGDFTMTGGSIVGGEYGVFSNSTINITISGGVISGKIRGISIHEAPSFVISGSPIITSKQNAAIHVFFDSNVYISGTPKIQGADAEFSIARKLTFNTQPAEYEKWRVNLDMGAVTDGVFAIPSESVTLDSKRFIAVNEGYYVSQNNNGELFMMICDHSIAQSAVANGDGTHNETCGCGQVSFTENIACFGGESKQFCDFCGYECPHENCTNGFCANGCYESAILNDDGYYEIGNAGQLYWFMEHVNAGNVTANAILTADIVVNEGVLVNGALASDTSSFREWFPIGYDYDRDGDGYGEYIYYKGTFDGDSHTISGLYFNNSNQNKVGLIGRIDGGTVKNVGVVDSYFHGQYDVGGVVGNNYGIVKNCYNTSLVSAKGLVGGVVGYNYKECVVENCYNTGTVIGTRDSVGGVVGHNFANVINCYNTGTVGGNAIYVGGVMGFYEAYENKSIIKNCYNTGNVSGNENVGGVLGFYQIYESESIVEYCYNTGAVSGNKFVGGVVGQLKSGIVENCYFSSEAFSGNAIGENQNGAIQNVKGMTAKQFASGEVAYLLGSDFGQDCSVEDSLPELYGKTVYKNQIGGCNEKIFVYGYANAEAEAIFCHLDNNSDHKCDGCEETLSVCNPNADDGDCTTAITCSICGKITTEANSEHTDADFDYKCDICGKDIPMENDPSAPTPDLPPMNTDKLTEESGTDKSNDEAEAPVENGCGGCGSSAALSAVALVGIIGAALVIKKKI